LSKRIVVRCYHSQQELYVGLRPVGRKESIMAFVLKTYAKPGDPPDPEKANVPVAPGAVSSPQIPGQVPDRSTIRGKSVLPVPPPSAYSRRPLNEAGTSQGIMGVFEPEGGNESDPARFEQATASYEELRKAYPNLRLPTRPTAGYALADGTRVANAELAALSSAATAEVDPGE
jgi:hypothetical protein